MPLTFADDIGAITQRAIAATGAFVSSWLLMLVVYVLPVLLSANSLVSAAPASSDVMPVPALINSLKSGGHIIYVRHATTDHSQKDQDRENLKNCDRQRNLSIEGREQAARIGRTIKALNIPVGNVTSSPYCRCKDTAELIFGEYDIDPQLSFSISKDREESERLGQHLYSLMTSARPGSSNTVFVGHTSNLKDGLGIWPKPEGVFVIFTNNDGKLTYKGMIRPDEWPEL